MDSSQAKQFGDELSAVFETCGKDKPSKQVKLVWWKALERYSVDTVLKALSIHVQSSSFMPRPHDIIEIITSRDGRPSPEEAWVLAIRGADEQNTVVWTSEVAAAMAFVQPLMNSGDNNVSARMAFKQHYERLLLDARASGTPVEWVLSLGLDAAAQADVIRDAEARGLISSKKAKQHLIEDMTPEGQAIVGLLGMSDNVSIHPTAEEHHKSHMEKLKADLAVMAEKHAREKQAKRDEAYKKIADRRALLEAQEKQLLAEAKLNHKNSVRTA